MPASLASLVRFVGFFALCALGTVQSRPVAAQPAPRVLVLPLSSDFLTDDVARILEEEVRRGVAEAMPQHVVLPKPALDLASMQVAAGCAADGPQCLALIGRTTQATAVVQVGLQGSTEKARLVVRRVQSRGGDLDESEAELTDVGRDSRKEVRWHVATGLGAKLAPLTGRIVLMVSKKAPPLDGAKVLLDDRPVTVASLKQVSPGLHRIEIVQKGFEPFRWQGAVRPGRDAQVRIIRTPRQRVAETEAPATASPPDAPNSVVASDEGSGPLWTWILGGAAVAAAGTATVFGIQVIGLESDAEEDTLDCDGDDRNDATCKDGRDRALMANIAWGVAGGLAVGAVISYFIESDDDDDDDDVSAQFGVSPTPEGVSAAVRMSF